MEGFLYSLIGKIDGLILAGDIFDLWIEWDKVIIKNYFSVLKIFSLLKDSGCRLIYLSGNHDFWLDSFFKKNLGVEIYNDFFVEVVNGKRIYVSHGDLYTKNDIRYQIFRRVIRSHLVRFMCRIIHPDLCLAMGQMMSRSSRKRKISDSINYAKEKGLIDKAVSLSKDYDIIVFGHAHNPIKKEIGESVYINCGDWINNSSYCYFDSDVVELKHFKLDGRH